MHVFMYLFFGCFHSKLLDPKNIMIHIFMIYIVLLVLCWVLGVC